MAVDDDDGSLGQERGHGGGLLGVHTYSNKTLPVFAGGRGAGAVFEQARGGEGDAFDYGGGGHFGLLGGDRWGDERDGLGGIGERSAGGGKIEGKNLLNGEFLGDEDAIEAFEREGSFAIEEVGDVSLLKAGLLGETRSGEATGIDAADQFEPQELLEIGKVHFWLTSVSPFA